MHWEKQTGRYPRDPRLGHRPGVSYKPINQSINQSNYLLDLHTTCDGFISLDCTDNPAISSKLKHIVILGGSTAMGLGASSNEFTIAAKLQALLIANGYKYRVINGACAAYASWQELLRFIFDISREEIHSVISISSWNDFVHSSIGDRYSGCWHINHDRSIDDLSDMLIGLDDLVPIIRLIKKKLLSFKLIYLLSKIVGDTKIEMTHSEVKWGYNRMKFVYKNNSPGNFVHNMSLIKGLSKEIGAHFQSYLQPLPDLTINSNHPASKTEQQIMRFTKLHPEVLTCKKKFYLALKNFAKYQPLDPGSFNNSDFVDHCHLNNRGQSMLALKVYQNLQPLL